MSDTSEELSLKTLYLVYSTEKVKFDFRVISVVKNDKHIRFRRQQSVPLPLCSH
jgi:hypothetical protein